MSDGSGSDDELATRRRSYSAGELTESGLADSWLEQLRAWYSDASRHPDVTEPNAMQVATVDAAGQPDVRTVLARGFDERGVVFYTNYDSAKGQQLAANPHVAAVFAWPGLERQVRLRGIASRVSPAETAAYFGSRPRGSQLAAWVSPQSQVIADRDVLDRQLAKLTADWADQETLEPPPFWGGYRIEVDEAEFWQGRQFRLHDRLRFRRGGDGGPSDWVVERLAP